MATTWPVWLFCWQHLCVHDLLLPNALCKSEFARCFSGFGGGGLEGEMLRLLCRGVWNRKRIQKVQGWQNVYAPWRNVTAITRL